ncbi:MAG: cell division protein FtsI (penicillin-binding protein 3) [Rhodothermales bacterium]|jgi:cell division protein FtsI (penicillin-binding protein 3)
MQIRDEILARMYVMLTLLGLVPVMVGLQVLRVGLIDADDLEAAGNRQTAAVAEIPAMRGSIADRKGRTLVVNTARYDIAVDPSFRGFDASAGGLYESLASITGRSAASYRRRVKGRASDKYALLERGLSITEVSRLQRTTPGLLVLDRHSRTYNYGTLASHILGYVDADLRGLSGVELRYDDELTGTAGSRDMQRDRARRIRPVAGGKLVRPDHGETVVTTIDLVLQTILEEELHKGVVRAGAVWGTAIAMDPKTGAILAMANVPTYDPNRPGDRGVESRRNHAIVDRVEPGSTFKLMTAVTAVGGGHVALDDTVDTGPGWVMLHGRTLRDSHANGRIPFREVISLSSNIGSARVAERGTRGEFYQTARSFGFGMPTGIDLPGEIPGRLDRVEKWSASSLSAMSRGYGIQATPLQILNAYAAFANRGLLMRPYVVQEIRDLTGEVTWRAEPDSIRRVMSRELAEKLLPAFELVVTDGTAKKAAIPGVRVAGKTGTAWKVKNGGVYSSRHSIATFVGFFPAEDPLVAMLVMMDQPKLSIYGGEVSAPVFAAAAKRWMPSLLESERPEAMAYVDSVTVPALGGLPTLVAERRLLAAGLETGGFGDELAQVTSQTSEAGSSKAVWTRVRVETSEVSMTEMPDLSGWTVRDAAFWLRQQGVEVQVQGNGSVKRQSPAAGATLPRQATIIAGD